ncbi:peptide ABC transporter permease [Candidatus Epulonipiscioides gigas]|nr:peptide ABC transporter permease [Epulopiscium sp. SCG-C07WGA-EpuloA2]
MKIIDTFIRMYRHSYYRIWLFILGLFTMLPIMFYYWRRKNDNDNIKLIENEVINELEKENLKNILFQEAMIHVINKQKCFNQNVPKEKQQIEAQDIANNKFADIVADLTKQRAQSEGIENFSITYCFKKMYENPLLRILSIIVSFPMYILILVFKSPILKYIIERLFMMIFVLFGVTFLVFTILYISPMEPALNILGQTATVDQVEQFNKVHGLDKSYIVQLFEAFKNLITFNLGNSYQGNEDIATSIMNKFPITIIVAFWAVFVSVAIAIPSGIISAIKQYSSFDYIFMFIALIGLSIPNFWLGLILILNFSIELQWLPATFQVNNSLSLIMPALVLGTGMSASVARMTRSSMLEVKYSDYILTARAKGLAERKVVLKHILGNAMIPIITMVGMQFGAMLGGSSVTEKVFNINGLGSWIVDKQFVPDIPVVLAGVVYISIVVSIVNLVIDILYAFIDPRIKSKMKNY